MPLAPPVALDDLGPLILRNHPLHLQEQVIFWAFPQGPVQQHHFHPRPPALIHQQHLVRRCAREAIRGVDLEAIHGPSRHDIPQPFQRRSDQCGPTIAFINELHGFGQGQALGPHTFPQRGHLTRDGVGLGLLVGRDPCLDRSLDELHACCLLPTCCVGGASSDGPAERAWGGACGV